MSRRRGGWVPQKDGKLRCRSCYEFRDDCIRPHNNAPAYCPDCISEIASSWSAYASRAAATRRKSKYGIDDNDHVMMFARQGGLCAICRDPQRSERTDSHVSGLVVDHDHGTGEVRGLLCARCNSAIGLLGDDPQFIARAYHYVTGRRIKLHRDHSGAFDKAIAALGKEWEPPRP